MVINGPVANAGSIFILSSSKGTNVPNMLANSTTAMLSQANLRTQNILQLLRLRHGEGTRPRKSPEIRLPASGTSPVQQLLQAVSRSTQSQGAQTRMRRIAGLSSLPGNFLRAERRSGRPRQTQRGVSGGSQSDGICTQQTQAEGEI